MPAQRVKNQSPSEDVVQLPIVRRVADLGPLLLRLRRNSGLTQEHTCRRSSLSVRFLSDVEHSRKAPSLGTLIALAHAVRHEIYILPADLVAQLVSLQKRLDGLAIELAALEKNLRPEPE